MKRPERWHVRELRARGEEGALDQSRAYAAEAPLPAFPQQEHVASVLRNEFKWRVFCGFSLRLLRPQVTKGS